MYRALKSTVDQEYEEVSCVKRILGVCLSLLTLIGLLVLPAEQAFAGGTTYYPPSQNWNGYKIYLSPAKHTPDNTGSIATARIRELFP